MNRVWRHIRRSTMIVAAVAATAVVATPATAQFSDGYKFLEAVRKKDGQAVIDALSAPGATLVNSRDLSNGETALHMVVQRRDLVWIRFLHQQGANLNIRNNKGETPLVVASNLGFVEGVEALVSLGARIDEANATGETPLIAATHRKDAAMARVLLKAGADPHRNDNSGRSALDYAKLDGRGNPVLSEIEATEKTRSAGSQAKAYGPSL